MEALDEPKNLLVVLIHREEPVEHAKGGEMVTPLQECGALGHQHLVEVCLQGLGVCLAVFEESP